MKVIDYLAEELKREEATKTRKAGKHERVTKMLKKLANAQPDFSDLQAVLGD